MNIEFCEQPEVGQVRWLDKEIAELSLLLPGWQAAELESLARSRRLTMGQLIRVIVRDFLACPAGTRSASESQPHGDHQRGWWPGVSHARTMVEKN